jgi:hypothetical protein
MFPIRLLRSSPTFSACFTLSFLCLVIDNVQFSFVPARIPRKRRIQTLCVMIMTVLMVLCVVVWLLLWYVSSNASVVCHMHNSTCPCLSVLEFYVSESEDANERSILTLVLFPHSGRFWSYIRFGCSLTRALTMVDVPTS